MNIRRTRGLGPRVPVDITPLLRGGYPPGGSVSRRSSERSRRPCPADRFVSRWLASPVRSLFHSTSRGRLQRTVFFLTTLLWHVSPNRRASAILEKTT